MERKRGEGKAEEVKFFGCSLEFGQLPTAALEVVALVVLLLDTKGVLGVG